MQNTVPGIVVSAGKLSCELVMRREHYNAMWAHEKGNQ